MRSTSAHAQHPQAAPPSPRRLDLHPGPYALRSSRWLVFLRADCLLVVFAVPASEEPVGRQVSTLEGPGRGVGRGPGCLLHPPVGSMRRRGRRADGGPGSLQLDWSSSSGRGFPGPCSLAVFS